MGTNIERFWALAAFNLTIAARETYLPRTERIAEAVKLRAYNEMLHRICSHIVAAHTGAAEDRSDSWLLPTLTEMAERSGIAQSLTWAIDDAKKKVQEMSGLDRESNA